MSIIAVDCDEVLIESIRSLSKYAKEKYDHSWLYEDFRDYFISNNDHIDMSAEESIVLFDEYFTSLHAEDAKPVA